MEDACVAVPNLLDVPLCHRADELLPPRIAPQLRSNSATDRSSEATTATHLRMGDSCAEPSRHDRERGIASEESYPSGSLMPLTIPNTLGAAAVETLHFFGVFDGHGGADAAIHCAKTLHERVREVLSSLTSPTGSGNGETESFGAHCATTSGNGEEAASMQTGSARGTSRSSNYADANAELHSVSSGSGSSFVDAVDMEDSSTAATGSSTRSGTNAEPTGQGGALHGVPCTAESMEAALTKAFHLTDEEFGTLGGYEHLALVGTTAVVALIGGRMIYVANCGDSRAVLSRSGTAVPLTDDHKAAREDETARVEAAGGQILFWNGVRVMGLLAVSRAIGDHSLRPYVIAEPEVTIINRQPGDELLVMASDGLWDVMSNQEACTLAKKCLLRARQRGSSRENAARVAATVLTRAAVDRGSRDNVTVVIVDLSLNDGYSGADAASLGLDSDSLPTSLHSAREIAPEERQRHVPMETTVQIITARGPSSTATTPVEGREEELERPLHGTGGPFEIQQDVGAKGAQGGLSQVRPPAPSPFDASLEDAAPSWRPPEKKSEVKHAMPIPSPFGSGSETPDPTL
jgi:protein phosphatase 2C